ncbi:hypothetical protein PTKIN_Ptkin16aG0108800 [Pterospermum kingtungense]
MIPGEQRWDYDLINSLFDNDTADAILQLPLSRFNGIDKLIWCDSPTGEFTVRSASMVARKVLGKVYPGRGPRNRIWRWIWGATLSPRIKHFIWRIVLNIIPTACNLSSKGITLDRECRICGSGDETIAHLLLDCVFACESTCRVIKLVLNVPTLGTDWCSPAAGWIKLNVDDAWSFTDGVTVVGCVARDADGVVLCSATQRFVRVDSVLFAELLAIRLGAELALHKSMSLIVIESVIHSWLLKSWRRVVHLYANGAGPGSDM